MGVGWVMLEGFWGLILVIFHGTSLMLGSGAVKPFWRIVALILLFACILVFFSGKSLNCECSCHFVSAFYYDLSLWIFFAACVSVCKSSTNLCLAGPHAKLVQTLIDSVLFLSNVYCCQ